MTPLETGVQFHLPTYAHIPLPHLIELAAEAEAKGVDQFWVTDNLRSRQSFVALAAMACRLKVKLGTAVTVQYFRNPVDLADSIATLTELMDGRELSIGLGRGNPRTPQLIRTPRPVSVLRETAQSLRLLLAGEAVCFADYPSLLDYYHFNPSGTFQLNFSPASPVQLYCGSNGPLGMTVGGETMDGLIFGGHYVAALRTGRVPELLDAFDSALPPERRDSGAPKVAEIKISLSRDAAAAREFVKESSYCGSNGPLGMTVGGETMDGLIFGGHYVAALRTGRVPELLDAFDTALPPERRDNGAPKVAEIKISLSRNAAAAREFVKESAGHRVLNMYRQGYSPEDIERLGVALPDVERLHQADQNGATEQEFDDLVTDSMIDAIFIAGTPGDCLERMLEVRDTAREQGFGQLMFSELGPDVDEALTLLCDEVMPAL